MTEEAMLFEEDLREKKELARNAQKKNRTGKGAMKTAMDYKTEGELKKMNGEERSWKLAKRVGWKEFRAMPHDIQQAYLDRLEERYQPTIHDLGELFGTSFKSVYQYIVAHHLKANRDKGRKTCSWKTGWRDFMATGYDEKTEPSKTLTEMAKEIIQKFKESTPETIYPPAPAFPDIFTEPAINVFPVQANFGFSGTVEEVSELLKKFCQNGVRYSFSVQLIQEIDFVKQEN